MKKSLSSLVKALFFAGLFCCENDSSAACISLINGPVVADAVECSPNNPEQLFSSGEARFENIRNLDPKAKARFYDSYRGFLVKVKVIESQATRSGLSPEQGALKGEEARFFVPIEGKLSCQSILGRRFKASVNEVCCDGGIESPCLVNTSYALKAIQDLGPATPGTANPDRKQTKKSPDYQNALVALKKKDFKEATALLEKVRQSGELDIVGRYRLGVAYRQLDDCLRAIPPLKENYEEYLKKKSWADEEKIIRASNFLLARCYARQNQPGNALLILNEYLLEPKKFQSELSRSLKHKDFGYIHTSKQYKDYKAEALKKLNN